MSESCCITHGKIVRPGCSRGAAKEIVQAWFACISDIETIPAATNHIVSGDITLVDLAFFYEIELDKTKSSYDFVSEGDGETQEYNNTVILGVAGVASVVTNITTGFPRSSLFLIIKDKNGNYRLLGAVGDGCNQKVQEKNDPNATTLTFNWHSADLPLYYTGAITVDE